MFFGHELNEMAVWAKHEDAEKACRWMREHAPNRELYVGTHVGGGFGIADIGYMQPVRKAWLLALMQRHDIPPVLVPHMVHDGIMRSRDVANVPGMAALPYYDVLPKERADVEPAAR